MIKNIPHKATVSHLKKHNEILVLREIYNRAGISRVEIADSTNISRPSVTEITQGLLQRGLIQELGPQVRETVGKKPTLLAFDADAYCMACIIINETSIVGSLLDLRARPVAQHSIPIDNSKTAKVVDQLSSVIKTLIRAANRPVLGIAVGTPGIVEPHTGTVQLAANFGWRNLPLGQQLAKRFKLPVCVGNDSDLIMLGEHRFGTAQGDKDLIVVKVDVGIGVGILSDGHIIHGHSYSAGEIGHAPFLMLDDECVCGRKGCLETLVSWWGLKRHAAQIVAEHPDSLLSRLADGHEITSDLLIQALAAGDQYVEALVEKAGTYLGQALTIMIHLLNPKQIILTGSLLQLGDKFLNCVREAVYTQVIPYMAQDVEFVVSPNADHAMMIGAGAMLLEQELGI